MSSSLAKLRTSNVRTWPGHVGLCWSRSPRGLSDGSLHPRAGPWGRSGGGAGSPDVISPPAREKIEFGPSLRRREGAELRWLLHREQDLQQQPFLLVLSGPGKPATGTWQDTRTQEQTMLLQATHVSLQPTWGIFGVIFRIFFFFLKISARDSVWFSCLCAGNKCLRGGPTSEFLTALFRLLIPPPSSCHRLLPISLLFCSKNTGGRAGQWGAEGS